MMYIKYIVLFSLFIGFILAGESSNQIRDVKTTDKINNKEGDIEGTTTSQPTKSTSKPITSSTSQSPPHTSTPTPPTSSSVSPTVLPSTMTTPAPQPSPSPTSPSTTSAPVPLPEFWTVTNSTTNVTCIVARMNIELEMHQGNESLTLHGNPKTLKANGKCGNNIQMLEIFMPQNGTDPASVLFYFSETAKTYFISSFSVLIPLNTSDEVYEKKNVTLYETGKNTSYSCPSYMVNLEPNNKTSVKLSMSNIQIEAFRSTNTTKFSQAVQCPNSEVPDIVPLIVGLALAGLVIVVVIGYFIGRRRSQARGYLSM